MISLLKLITEDTGIKPKVVVMAGGSGAGKSHVLNKLGINSLEVLNPDKYVEDPNHPYYNNLSAASGQVDRDAQELAEKGESFIWDTTASNPAKIKTIIDRGYDVYMVMVYTHPMVSFISNFKRERRVPKSAVFSTWRNVYKLIEQYKAMLGDNLSIFVNRREDKYGKEIEDFNKAAENGVAGVTKYLQQYMEANGGQDAFNSSFRKPFELQSEELIKTFEEDMKNVDFDRGNESMTKELKKYWLKFYEKKEVGPGEDKMKKKVASIERTKENNKKREIEVLSNIATMILDREFQEQLKHSSESEIESKVQNFLT